jgi:hypothetical protein
MKYFLIASAIFFLTGPVCAQQDAPLPSDKNMPAVDTIKQDTTAKATGTEAQQTLSHDSTDQIIKQESEESYDTSSVENETGGEQEFNQADFNKTAIASIIELEKKKQFFIDKAGKEVEIASRFNIAGLVIPLVGGLLSAIAVSGDDFNKGLFWTGNIISLTGGVTGGVGEIIYLNKSGQNLQRAARIKFNLPLSNPFYFTAFRKGGEEQTNKKIAWKKEKFAKKPDISEQKKPYFHKLTISEKSNARETFEKKRVSFSLHNSSNKNLISVIVRICYLDQKGEVIYDLQQDVLSGRAALKAYNIRSFNIKIKTPPTNWKGKYKIQIVDFKFVQ